jgi:hypothetical protein
MRRPYFLGLVAGFALLQHGAARSESALDIQPIVRFGETVGTAGVKIDNFIWVGSLNDTGQISFTAETAAGGEALVQYAGGELTVIAAPDRDGPAGKWPKNNWFFGPVSMNQRGDIAFSGLLVRNTQGSFGGTYLWDYESRQVQPLALPGQPVGDDQSFVWAGGPTPVIDDRGAITFSASVKDRTGKEQPAVFLRRPDGDLAPVALPGQSLPGNTQVVRSYSPSFSQDGGIVFLARRASDQLEYPYRWENGTLTALPVTGISPPTGTFLLGFVGLWGNPVNRSVLLNAHFYSLARHAYPLYLLTEGGGRPVAISGQEMPGGGRFQSLQEAGVSTANARGQHVLLARLQDGTMSAYLLEPSGGLSLLIKTGMETARGTITHLGENAESLGAALNSQGQIALVVRIDGGEPTLVVLTPVSG